MRTKLIACILPFLLLLLFPLHVCAEECTIISAMVSENLPPPLLAAAPPPQSGGWMDGGADVCAEDAGEMLDGILQYKLSENGADSVQEWIDGELTQNAGMTSEWYILALSRQGGYDFSGYARALSGYLAENSVSSASTRLKLALVQNSIGVDAQIPPDSIGEQGVMSNIFGLHLLHHGCVSDAHTEESLVDAILAAQLPDGGWALSGTVSDPDVTAMALQALAPHAQEHPEPIDRALERLSGLQQETGDYASYGVKNPESTAQVLMALVSLGLDPMEERFLKNGNSLLEGIALYRLPDGSFCHTQGGASNYNATAQVFLALTAYTNGQNPYLFQEPTPPAPSIGYKLPVILIISGVGVIVCIVMLCRKKRSIKTFLPVIVLTAAGIVFVWLTDFQSAEEYYQPQSAAEEEIIGTVSISIRCDTVAGRAEHIPENGEILPETEVSICEGDTVFDVLTHAAQQYSIQMEYSGTPQLAYVSGIGYLYEYDFGDLSGWVYHVNGESLSVGCGEHPVTDGDAIEWLYSCDLGEDVK